MSGMVIGLGCRLPGARDCEEFWSLLLTGRSPIRRPPPERWDVVGLDAVVNGNSEPQVFDSNSMWTGGFLDESVYGFDWKAFGISPKEARRMDPQQRLLLEVVSEALDDAGRSRAELAGKEVGVFVGAGWADYQRMLLRSPEHIDGYSASGTPLSLLSSRVAHHFDWRGPAVTLDANCASSLAALDYALKCLSAGDCELALVAGVNLMLSPDAHLAMQRAGVLSASGRTRTLDVGADGFVRGEGAVALLIGHGAALRAGDRAYAEIVGCAVNHNGRSRWIMAPDQARQEAVVRKALAQAAVDVRSTGYVELHGTAFKAGDEIETEVVAAAYGTSGQATPCAVGALKSNIGNLEAAAAVASLAKVCLCLSKERIVPTVNIDTVNSELCLKQKGLEPVLEVRPWPQGREHAGVHVTSFCGVNGHIVVKRVRKARSRREEEGPWAFPVSQDSTLKLAQQLMRMHGWVCLLESEPDVSLNDICYTLSLRREHRAERACVVAASLSELKQGLEELQATATDPTKLLFTPPPGYDEGEFRRYILGHDESERAAGALQSGQPSRRAALLAVAALYRAGAEIHWERVVGAQSGRVVGVPTRVWDREELRSPAADPALLWGAEIQVPALEPVTSRNEWARASEHQWVERLQRLPEKQRQSWLAQRLVELSADLMEMPADIRARLSVRLSFFQLGLTSVSLAGLRTGIERRLGLSLTVAELLACATPWLLAEKLLTRAATARVPDAQTAAPETSEAKLLAALDSVEGEWA